MLVLGNFAQPLGAALNTILAVFIYHNLEMRKYNTQCIAEATLKCCPSSIPVGINMASPVVIKFLSLINLTLGVDLH